MMLFKKKRIQSLYNTMSAYLTKQQTRCVRVYTYIYIYILYNVLCVCVYEGWAYGRAFAAKKNSNKPASSLSSMFDQLNCIKLRIDFAIIGNQSQMDFFFVLLVAHKAVVFNLSFFYFCAYPEFFAIAPLSTY